ncbi:Uncharacterised protein [Vibrio cholerae]|nr:Uncharacterised protein [Vibrio cholerae]
MISSGFCATCSRLIPSFLNSSISLSSAGLGVVSSLQP